MKKMLILLAFVASLLSCGKDQKELSVTVSTGAATQITVSSATLNASFSNAVGLVREVGFKWGESATELGHTQQADWNLGQTSFSATIDNLGDNKTYYYRAYVILYDKDCNPYIAVETQDAPVWGLWSPPFKNAPFVCIEPWMGRCDYQGYEGDISGRDYINRLEPGKSTAFTYRIQVL